ncbi:unnamed protein product [Rotaria sp. Silwood2]|nr:unnamed protein product [Rotaria sp. Silwood2]
MTISIEYHSVTENEQEQAINLWHQIFSKYPSDHYKRYYSVAAISYDHGDTFDGCKIHVLAFVIRIAIDSYKYSTYMGASTGVVKNRIHLPNKQDYEKLAFTLSHIFSPEECQEWIKMSEEIGYSIALLNVGGDREIFAPKYRDSSRCLIDSSELAQKLFLRLEPFLPRTWKNGQFELVGLNERLRFLRYDPSQKFLPHTDGQYRRQDGSGEESFLTIQLYLNEGFQGGETAFIATDNPKNRVSFVIKTGMVLIFEHRIVHEGTAVKQGRKYTMRTDVMYRPIKNNS